MPHFHSVGAVQRVRPVPFGKALMIESLPMQGTLATRRILALPGNLQAGIPIVTMETPLAGSALEGATV
jgi:hypothetical protein